MTQVASFHDCDVIIVNYNAGKLLADRVSLVFAAGAARAIVVDNNSTDSSLEYLERIVENEKLSVLCSGKNLGLAIACNIGARTSAASQVLFLNPDSVLATDALARMVEVVEHSETIGMAGDLLCSPDGSEHPGWRRVFPTPKRAFMLAFGLSRLARFFPEFFLIFFYTKSRSLLSQFLLGRFLVPV